MEKEKKYRPSGARIACSSAIHRRPDTSGFQRMMNRANTHVGLPTPDESPIHRDRRANTHIGITPNESPINRESVPPINRDSEARPGRRATTVIGSINSFGGANRPKDRCSLTFYLFFILLFCWIATAAESAPHPRFGGALQAAIFQPITTLNPVNYLNFAELQVASNLYEGLVKRDRFGRMSPAIAQSWSHLGDHRIWTFVIARGLTFHNGKPVTATDVKLAWERFVRQGVWKVFPQPLALIRGAEAYHNDTVTQIVGIRVLDDFHLQVILRAGDPKFLEKLTSPAAWVTTRGDSQPIGTGQFRLESFDRAEVRLTANSDYIWGSPYLEKLTFRYYANLDAALFEFESGVLDALPLPITAVERRQREGLDDILIQTEAATLVYLRLPDEGGISNLSQAVSAPNWHNVLRYALDTHTLLNLQYGENPSKMVFVPFAFPHNRVKARRRLKHSGWNSPIKLVYGPLPDNTGNAIATWLERDSLSQIGLQVEIRAADSDTLQGGFEGDVGALALLSMPIEPRSDVSSLEIGRSESLIPLYLLPSNFLCQPKVRGVTVASGGVLTFERTWLVR